MEISRNSPRSARGSSPTGARPLRCLVYLNSRDDAERARDHLLQLAGLRKQRKGQAAAADVELMVGARRVFERTGAADALERLGYLGSEKAPGTRPAFLFSTSAGEVGVDLDADHMVCDLVPWERMVQRLGRVNRRGAKQARVVVLRAPPAKDEPPEIETRRDRVVALIGSLPANEDGSRDVSPGALDSLQRAARADPAIADTMREASTPDPLYPPLERPTVEAWSMTSLRHHPGRPSIAPWLRGWGRDNPQTAVTWRRRFPWKPSDAAPDRSVIEQYLEAAPPHASEVLETDTFRVIAWLTKRAQALLKHVSGEPGAEVLGRHSVVAVTRSRGVNGIRAWSLDTLAASGAKGELQNVLPGADLVLHADMAGLGFGLLDPRIRRHRSRLTGSRAVGSRFPFASEKPTCRSQHRIRDGTRDSAFQCCVAQTTRRLPVGWLWRSSAPTRQPRRTGQRGVRNCWRNITVGPPSALTR